MTSIPITDSVWRIALVKSRDSKNKQIPAICNFQLNKNDDYRLSVDWESHTTPEESIARVGATYKFNKNEYKEYSDREIYAIKVSDLAAVRNAIVDVLHDPILHNPCKKGSPNNPSHSSICFNEASVDPFDAPEIFTKIRDLAKNNKIEFNIANVHKLVHEYRSNCTEDVQGTSD